MDTQQHQSTNYLTKFIDTITQVKSVNKTDAQTLLHAFGSFESVLNASHEQLSACPGFRIIKSSTITSSI
jgi:DNA excision repair protein ERCC-1